MDDVLIVGGGIGGLTLELQQRRIPCRVFESAPRIQGYRRLRQIHLATLEEQSMTITRHDPTSILSNAVQHGDTVYLAGVVAKNLDQDVKAQTRQVLDEIDRLLAKCGSNKAKVLTATIWVTDIRNRAPMNEVWSAWVDARNLPARACVEAKLADPKALVEIMVIAGR